MFYLIFFLWAIIGAQLFQFSAYIPQNRWIKVLYYAAAGPLIWVIAGLDKLK